MKRISALLLFASMLVACSSGSEKVLSASNGRINDVKIILQKTIWEGNVGDALREVLAAPVDGLPQEEPLFTLNQIEPEIFTGFMRKNRNYLRVEKSDTSAVMVQHNVWAAPQTEIVIKGSSQQKIAELIKENGNQIVTAFRNQELYEKQRRIKKSLKKDDSITKTFGIDFNFPTAYRYAKQEPNFFWMRKNLKSGDMNITIYEVPLKTLDRDEHKVARLVRMRDSIGGKNIPVDNGRFITERAYTPYVFETEIDGHFAYETKGTWEVDGRYMAGPFVNYAIRDEANDRYLVVEGFIFSPSVEKRDNVFELEAIIKSLKFINSESVKTP